MTALCNTPVVVILFNRPNLLHALIKRLRDVKPSHLLVIADGPRHDRPADVELCHAARQIIASVDWPCRIDRNEASQNMGCDQRIMTGLDWAFGLVDRAIILEDDILPTPDFFRWAERMLVRHDGDDRIAMVCGHNPLAVWGDPRADGILAKRGSVWGWATWAGAWRRINATCLAGDPEAARDEINRLGLDPLLSEHLAIYLTAWRQGRLSPWDLTMSVKRAINGDWAIVSPANLVRHCGAQADATHLTSPNDFSSSIPVFAARQTAEHSPLLVQGDASFDRASVLVELMSRCANPAVALRLARALPGDPAVTARLPVEPRLRHHLSPFRMPEESAALLEHLKANGLRSGQAEEIAAVLRTAVHGNVAS